MIALLSGLLGLLWTTFSLSLAILIAAAVAAGTAYALLTSADLLLGIAAGNGIHLRELRLLNMVQLTCDDLTGYVRELVLRCGALLAPLAQRLFDMGRFCTSRLLPKTPQLLPSVVH